MNNWYATDQIAKQRREDFQREADVESLLTSLHDLGEPSPGPIDRLFRSFDRIKAQLTGGLERRLSGLRHGGLSDAGRHSSTRQRAPGRGLSLTCDIPSATGRTPRNPWWATLHGANQPTQEDRPCRP